jgi:hypothetical protein
MSAATAANGSNNIQGGHAPLLLPNIMGYHSPVNFNIGFDK